MNKFVKRLILASNSPRRREILAAHGFEFEIMSSNFKEVKNEIFNEKDVIKNSLGKALDVARSLDFDALVIGADTVVILDSVCLNKPRNFSEAVFMLKNLSGKTHCVKTAIAVVEAPSLEFKTKVVSTDVTFKKLSEDEILKYLNNKKPFDKAGSYGIQDFLDEKTANCPNKASFIQKIKGDFLNVVGISPVALQNLLLEF